MEIQERRIGTAQHTCNTQDQQHSIPDHRQGCRRLAHVVDIAAQPGADGIGADGTDEHDEVAGRIIVRRSGINKAPGADAEHPAQPHKGAAQIRREEEHPANDDQQEGSQDPQELGYLLQKILQHEFFQQQNTAVEQAPEDKVPVGPVPDAGEGPDDQQITDGHTLSSPAATQRNVHIVPEPGTQRDMPAAPELCDGSRQIGIVEVLFKVEAEHLGNANGHIGITAEIKIQHQAVTDGTQPGCGNGDFPCGQGSYRIEGGSDGIAQQHLLGKADQKQTAAAAQLGRSQFPFMDLRFKGCILDDGTGDQLREECNKQRKVQNISGRRGLIPIHIKQIGQHREGKEGDAQRHAQLPHRNGGPQQGIDVLDDEAPILEESQQKQIDDHSTVQGELQATVILCLFLLCHLQAGEVVEENGQNQKQHIFRAAPGKKQQAEQQQQHIFTHHGHQFMEQQHHGKKDKQERNIIECHTFPPYSAPRNALAASVQAALTTNRT